MAKFTFNDSDPVKKLKALETFIEYWVGPRKVQFGATSMQLEGLKIPAPLQQLYEFCFNWPGKNSQQSGIQLLSVQNKLFKLKPVQEFYMKVPHGLVIFADENQGVTSWATLDEGDDPPVYGLDYEWGSFYKSTDGQEHRRWTEISPSLTDFLIGFSLYELCMASNITHLTPLIEYIRTNPSVAVLTKSVHGHPAMIRIFDEDILVFNWDWDSSDTWIFAARDDVALAKLQKFAGTITSVNITTRIDSKDDLPKKWFVNFKADGSGSVSSSRSPKFLSQDVIPDGSISINEIVAAVEPYLSFEQSKDCLSAAQINREVVQYVESPKNYLPNTIVQALFKKAIAAIKNPSPKLQEQLENGSPLDW